MKLLFISSLLSTIANALTIGTVNTPFYPSFKINVNGKQLDTKLVLDSNWMWLHSEQDIMKNCYPNGWDTSVCPDPVTCWNNCVIELATSSQWQNPYGVTLNSDTSVTLKYVTIGQYSTNIGSRMYLLNGTSYLTLNLMNREISFDADMHQLGCGLNGAIYLINMPSNGGPNLAHGYAATAGLAYGDAQCTNVKFINGQATGMSGFYSTGACTPEFDIWEANNAATQLTAHNCKSSVLTACNNDTTCGRGSYRYSGFCDLDGAYWSPWQAGNHSLYGFGMNFLVDTSKPFTVKTQFITSDNTDAGDLVEVRRYYVQNGKTIYGGSLTDATSDQRKALYGEVNYHKTLGGLKAMGNALRKGSVLAISLWDDATAQMLWLDGVWTPGSTAPGASRGPCSSTSGDPTMLRQTVPNSQVTYSNFVVQNINSSDPITPAPAPSPSPPSPSQCSQAYQQCGGIGWTGPTCCVDGYLCAFSNNYYSQCLPNSNPPTPAPSPVPSPINSSYWKCMQCTLVS